jgi:DNA-binding MarR family transcriptional regulator
MNRRRLRLASVDDAIDPVQARTDDVPTGLTSTLLQTDGAARAHRPSHRELAQTLFDHRRARVRWFGKHAKVFQDSAWDVLLELFLCHEDGRSPSTTSVAYGAGVPITTALRALKKLEANGLVESRMDDVDTRVRRIAMTTDAVRMMRGYLDEV